MTSLTTKKLSTILDKEQSRLEKIKKANEEREKKRILRNEIIKTTASSVTERVKPVTGAGKRVGNVLGQIADNFAINTERINSRCNVGDRVKITSGMYSGKEMKLEEFVVGGIKGHLNGNEVRIKHGSFRRL